MKKMHLPIRLLSLLLAVALLCGLAAPARAVGTGGTRPSFTQVDHRRVLEIRVAVLPEDEAKTTEETR